MVEPTLGSFWDAIRWWASSVGLLTSQGKPGEVPPRPPVPEGVCASCPICQAAATLEQVDPKVMADLTIVARSVISGLGAALAEAAVQRTGEASAPHHQAPEPPGSAAEEPTPEEQQAGEPTAGRPDVERTSAEETGADRQTVVAPALDQPRLAEPATPKPRTARAGSRKQGTASATAKTRPTGKEPG